MHCSRRPARPGGTRSSCRTSGARLERERARRIETIARQRDEAGGLADWEAEREAIAELIASWDVPHEQIAVAVPTNRMVTETASRLSGHGIPALEIGPDGPRGDDGVHIGTMFRFKGLEYQHMIIAGASDGLVPRAKIQRRRHPGPGHPGRLLARGAQLVPPGPADGQRQDGAGGRRGRSSLT